MLKLGDQLLHARLKRRLLLLRIGQPLLKAGVVARFLTLGEALLMAFVITLRLRLFARLLLHSLEELLLLVGFRFKHLRLRQDLRCRLVAAA